MDVETNHNASTPPPIANDDNNGAEIDNSDKESSSHNFENVN